VVPPDWIKKMPTQDDNTCYLTNSTIVNFRYISQRGKQNVDGSTTSNLLSATYDWIGIDQIEDPEIVHKDLLDLMGRLRGQTPYRPDGEEDTTMPDSGPRWLMLTSNPTSNWVYKEIIKPIHVFKRTGRRMKAYLHIQLLVSRLWTSWKVRRTQTRKSNGGFPQNSGGIISWPDARQVFGGKVGGL
jgi:hypothetical protein